MTSAVVVLVLSVASHGSESCSEWPDRRPAKSAARAGEAAARLAVARQLLSEIGPEDGKTGRVVCLEFDRLAPSRAELRGLGTPKNSVKNVEACQKALARERQVDCKKKRHIVVFVRDARWCSDTELLVDAGTYSASMISDEGGCSYRAKFEDGTWRATPTEWCWIH